MFPITPRRVRIVGMIFCLKIKFDCAQVAQLVEQRTENPRVGGSSPPLGTTFPVSDYLPH
jgi:hypothetical protein